MRNDYLVRKTYLSFVVAAILTSLTATAGMLIDNIIVGQTLGDDALGAMGIIGPVSLIFSACGNVCATGGGAKAAQALGQGRRDRVREIFTVNMLFVLAVGGLFTVLGMAFAPRIALLLGARGALLAPATQYLYGYFLGAIPTIAVSAMMSFVRMDGSPRLPLLSIAVMSLSNVGLDFLMIYVFDLGMLGMALATTISYVLALATACLHFLKKDIALGFARPRGMLKELGSTICTGAPAALSRICDTVKVMLMNHMLVAFVSVGAVTALSVRTQANNFLGAVILGICQAITPTVGMFFGEEDRTAMRDTLKITLRFGLILVSVLTAVTFFASSLFCALLGVREGELFGMAREALRILAVTLPVYLINVILMNYYQCTKQVVLSAMICLMQSLIYPVSLALALILPFAERGVWCAFPIGEVLTLITVWIIVSVKRSRPARSLDDFMLLAPDFGGEAQDRAEWSIGNSMDEVMTLSEGIDRFGEGRSIDEKTLKLLSLCVEELAGNVVRHAFKPNERRWLDLTVLDKPDRVIFRIRDNGSPFDPLAYLSARGEEKYGIKMIHALSEQFEYRRAMGLNHLIVHLKKT